jgi:hypothetical protein
MGWDAGHEFQRFLTATGIFLGEPQSLANPSETVVRFSWARSVLGPVQFLGPFSSWTRYSWAHFQVSCCSTATVDGTAVWYGLATEPTEHCICYQSV